MSDDRYQGVGGAIPLPLHLGMTLERSQTLVSGHAWEKGSTCLCCGQFAKVYRRKLNATMARGLIWTVKQIESGSDWIIKSNSPKWLLASGGEFAKLLWWRLMEQPYEDGETIRAMWRPTQLGTDFVYAKTRVPKYVYLYNNTLVGTSDKLTTIIGALGSKFSYQELMKRTHSTE